MFKVNAWRLKSTWCRVSINPFHFQYVVALKLQVTFNSTTYLNLQKLWYSHYFYRGSMINTSQILYSFPMVPLLL